MNDWQTAQNARDAAAKRSHLESVDRAIVEVEQHLQTARDFEGHFASEIAAAERAISAIDTQYDPSWPRVLRAINDAGRAEVARLRGVRDAIVAERDERRKAATVTAVGQFGRALSLCLLDSNQVTRRLGQLRAQRGQLCEELAVLESRCTPGELVQAGIPAPQAVDYRRRYEELRQGGSVVTGYSA